jgi:acyl CoA:acetate/3-ketoacid CoA transferase
MEIAPGVDLEKDVLGQMEFTPRIAENLKTMDSSIFTAGLIGLADRL